MPSFFILYRIICSDIFNERAAFDWCFKRVTWWELNKSRGWEERYCRSNPYPFGQYGQVRWDSKFWHHRGYSFDEFVESLDLDYKYDRRYSYFKDLGED